MQFQELGEDRVKTGEFGADMSLGGKQHVLLESTARDQLRPVRFLSSQAGEHLQ